MSTFRKIECPHCGEKLLLEIEDESVSIFVPIEAIETEAETPEPKKQTTVQRKAQSCSICGKEGHSKRTCTKIAAASIAQETQKPVTAAQPEPKRQEDEDTRSLRQKIYELWQDGLAVEEVYDVLPDYPMPEIVAVYADIEKKNKNRL